MRVALYAAATVAIAAAFSPTALAGALAAAASALCEAVPFLLAGTLLQALLRDDRLVAYAGCGCTRGPSARSIPAAAATAIIFGVWIALARLLAATLVAAIVARRIGHHACPVQPAPLLADLHALAAAAVVAGCAAQLNAYVSVAMLPPQIAALCGAVLAFLAAPCALGSVTIAAALHARAPAAAAAFLCVAGIVDLRALFGHDERRRAHADASAYVVLAIALAIVAARQGDALVRPAVAPLLAISAAAAAVCGICHRGERNAVARWPPAIMLAGALVSAPPPAYTATETTLTDIFDGERVDFTGRLTRNRDSAALVRYAITCCRADATPVVVRLSVAPPMRAGEWVRASGSIENTGDDVRLRASHIEAVAPPGDPFIYR